MGYPINLTNNAALITPVITTNGLPDGSIDTSTGLTLIGRNYTNYGDLQNENFLHLLENFADTIPPTQSLNAQIPLVGTLWYDTANQRMRVYDGTNWNNVSERFVSSSTPASNTNTIKTGDQWYDTTNQQLNVWTGSTWSTIGPAYSALLGVSGAIVESISDSAIPPNQHTVVSTYVGNNRASVINLDAPFTPSPALPGFNILATGLTMANGTVVSGTATNSQTVGNIAPASFARVDQATAFTSDVTVNGNINFGQAQLSYNSTALALQNSGYLGNVDVYMASVHGNVSALHIDGSSAQATVYADPVLPLGISTKQYVDHAAATVQLNLVASGIELTNTIYSLNAEMAANVTAANVAIANTNTALTAAEASIGAEISALTNTMNTGFVNANLATAALQTEVTNNVANLYTLAQQYARLDSPVFVGKPTVPVVPVLANYLAEISSLTYLMEFTQLLTVTAGDYITQYASGTNAFISNVQVATTASNFFVTVRLINGNVTTSPSGVYVNQNGTLTSAEVISFAPSGVQPAFLGLNDTTLGTTNGTSAATTSYVDLTANLLYGDYSQRISNLTVSQSSALSALASVVAPLHSPPFSGTPTAPTPTDTDTSANIATAKFVSNLVTAESTIRSTAISNLATIYAPINNPVLTGTPRVPTQPLNNRSTAIASTEYVDTTVTLLAANLDIQLTATAITSQNAIAAAIAPLANIANPTFTGAPKAPTPTSGDNSTNIATTAFVNTALVPYALIQSPTFTGTPRAPTVSSGDNSTSLATTGFVFNAVQAEAASRSSALAAAVALLAPLNSPVLTGNPTAPTQVPHANNNTLATTAYVDNAASTLASDYNGKITLEINTRAAAISAAIAPLATINSPVFTGTPYAPTPTGGDSTGRIATTAFVANVENTLNAQISSSALTYNVSSSPPPGGVPTYNFWFQI